MSRPEWQDRLDDALAVREPRATRRSIAVNYPPELYPLVFEAAKLRGMSMAAYQRRAALAFAQLDLGFDWETEMAAEPAFGTFVESGRSAKHGGRGFGFWLISAVRDA